MRRLGRRRRARRPAARAVRQSMPEPARARLGGGCSRARCARRSSGRARPQSRTGSSGTPRRPARARRRGSRWPSCGAADGDRSRRSSGRSAERRASTSSRWPLPDTPAMPTISPRVDGEVERRAARDVAAVAGTGQLAQLERRRAVRRSVPAARRAAAARGWPTIASISSVVGQSCGQRRPRRRSCRRAGP